MRASRRDFERLLIGEPVVIHHDWIICRNATLTSPPSRIVFVQADPNDFLAQDVFKCDACGHEMPAFWFSGKYWFSEKYEDYVKENYTVPDRHCICGAQKASKIQPYAAGHSPWCEVAAGKR